MVQRALNVYSVHLVFRGISERLGKYCKESDYMEIWKTSPISGCGKLLKLRPDEKRIWSVLSLKFVASGVIILK